MRIMSGSCGNNIAFRVEKDRVLSGGCGFNIAYRIGGDRILSGSAGNNVVYRLPDTAHEAILKYAKVFVRAVYELTRCDFSKHNSRSERFRADGIIYL